MNRDEYYADRLYDLAITAPTVDATSEHEIARYIRSQAELLCLDWREVLQEAGDLTPYVLDFKSARTLAEDEDYWLNGGH